VGQTKYFLWRFCAFLNKGKLLWGECMSKTFCQKVEGGGGSPVMPPLRLFFNTSLAFLCVLRAAHCAMCTACYPLSAILYPLSSIFFSWTAKSAPPPITPTHPLAVRRRKPNSSHEMVSPLGPSPSPRAVFCALSYTTAAAPLLTPQMRARRFIHVAFLPRQMYANSHITFPPSSPPTSPTPPL
jgi:hypothetical protein